MSGNTIEAKLLIAAEVAQAIGKLRELRREVLQTTGGAGKASGEAAAKAQATQEVQATKAAAAETRALRQAERQAEAQAARQARAEQVAADRAASAQRRAAARAEAEEQRKLRQAQRREEAEARQVERQAQRRVRAADNQQANALAQVPAQVTDIVTSLQGGQSPLTVLIQQGGQLRDSFGGVGNALRALLGLLTPARVVIGGVAAAIAGVAVAAVSGYLETDRLNKSLALTGNQAGQTLSTLDASARRIAQATGVSVKSVRDTLEALISSGGQTTATLDSTARAITAYRKLTGATAAEAVQLFDGQASAVLDWSNKANKAYAFLSAAQLDYIRTLQAQGRPAEAVRFVNEELAKTLEERTIPALGVLERAWKKVSAAISDAFDRVKDIGREGVLDVQIRQAQERIQFLRKEEATAAALGRPTQGIANAAKAAEKELAALEARREAERKKAEDDAKAQAAEQKLALEQSKAYVDAEISVQNAGIQKRLAGRLAALDRERDAVQASRARDLISETDANLQLNNIERRRLEEQAAALRERLDLEGKRKIETPLDSSSRLASVRQIEAQLLDVQSQIQQAASEGQNILARDGREQSELWQKAWEEAASRIRAVQAEAAASANARVEDPLRRAREAGRLAAEELRRDIEQQARSITESVRRADDPVRAGQLEQQLQQLREQGEAVIRERARKAEFTSLQDSVSQQIEAQQLLEADLSRQVLQGAITTEEAERRKLAARQTGTQQLQSLAAIMRTLATTPEELKAVESLVKKWEEQVSSLNEVQQAVQGLKRSAVSELVNGLTDIQTGAKSAGEALKDMVAGFARAILNVLNQQLAKRLVESLLGSIEGTGTGKGNPGAIGNLFSNFVASFFHTGGVIGQGAGRVARVAMPLAFAGAQVLHNGGLVLKANERAVVAEVGEEMLTEDDPRHVKNYKGAGLSMSATFVFQGGGSNEAQRADGEALLARIRMVCEQYVGEQMRAGGRLSGVNRG